MIYNSREAINFLGNAANNLDILRNKKFPLTTTDFKNNFHKIIFATLQNLALENDIVEADGVAIDSYLSKFDKQYATFIANDGIEFIENIKIISKNTSATYAFKTIKKYSLLNSLKAKGFDITELYNDNPLLDLKKQEEQKINLDKMEIDDIINFFNLKFLDIKTEFNIKNSKSYSFLAGDELVELIEDCQLEAKWGKTFQSKYINTIIRGMMGSKYLLRSAPTGGGKSRQTIADACNLAVSEIYDVDKNKWVSNGNKNRALFITTELTKEECQYAMLAFVSGLNELIIKNGKWSEEQKARLIKAAKILEESPLYCEFITDFTIEDIETIIERNIIQHDIKYIFFDYLQITPSLAAEIHNKFKMGLREDQILAYFSSALKEIATVYDCYMATSTQLNRSYKYDNEPDATHLRGGLATADKADYGIISMPVGLKEKEKLAPLLERGFSTKSPTLAHFIFKNRGGAYKGVVVWTHFDMGNMRETDCFVTNLDYEIIEDIEPTILNEIPDIDEDKLKECF